MQAYLAAKYMSGVKADAILAKASSSDTTKKKKKRKGPSTASTSTAMIVDDDTSGWGHDPNDAGDDDDTTDAVVASDRRFRKKQKTEAESGWAVVREGQNQPNDELPDAPDEQPQLVQVDEQPFKGGLMSAAQMKKALGKSKLGKDEPSADEIRAAQETVYRDASGRIIDTNVERADAARKKREREELEAKKMEWGKGLVQREEAEKRRRDEELLKGKHFSRNADDVEMNEGMKAQDRWDDPAAAFISKKRSKGPRKPEYTGPPPPPNRFSIKPGYRWDGVDRGNGFEKKLFQRQNERKRRGLESYQWSIDDM